MKTNVLFIFVLLIVFLCVVFVACDEIPSPTPDNQTSNETPTTPANDQSQYGNATGDNNATESHEHTFSTSWTHDDTYHWHTATCGHSVEQGKGAHIWDDGVIVKAATETEEGEKMYTCTVCGFIKKEMLSKIPSVHIPVEPEETSISDIVDAIAKSAEIQKILGLSDASAVYVNASRELVSDTRATGTYASMHVMCVSNRKDVEAIGAGDVVANLYYISVIADPWATATEIGAAQKAAYDYVYTLFTQINAGRAPENVVILFAPGTVLDAGEYEWKPVKTFCGYFGAIDAEYPVVVKKAKLTNATGYVDTLYFDTTGSKYFITGFFGALYGDAVVENVRFLYCTINRPGSDFDMSLTSANHSRHSVGIIGGVIDAPTKTDAEQYKQASNVVIRNLNVESTVSITGEVTAAGLIGYVGGCGSDRAVFNGSLLIENCHVSATVVGGPESGDYGPCGGLIGFTCRACENGDMDGDGIGYEIYNIIIRDCVFDGSVKGYRAIGAVVGNIQNGLFVFEGTNDFSDATLDIENCTDDDKSIVALIGEVGGSAQSVIIFSTATEIKKGELAAIGAVDIDNVQRNATDYRTNSSKYLKLDTITDADGNPIGANNGVWGE